MFNLLGYNYFQSGLQYAQLLFVKFNHFTSAKGKFTPYMAISRLLSKSYKSLNLVSTPS